jgi:hypothetical protein
MESTPMSEPQGMEVIERFTQVLDALGISYAIGGSVASSAYGTARFTQDADIVVEPFTPLVERFLAAIKDEFYISEQAMHQALLTRGSFNIIHFKAAFKIDIFIQGRNEFEQHLIARSREAKLSESARVSLHLVSPEDIILLKLRWFQEGGCVSQRQWTDVLGVLRVQKQALDFEYMEHGARELGFTELLQRAITESQIGT